MIKAIHKRREDGEEGFTLIELTVVVLIIAILIAVAIPTFLGARKRAQDRAAQSNLRNALTAAKVYYADNQRYTNEAAVLSGLETSVQWTTTEPWTSKIYVENPDPQVICLLTRSASGADFAVRDVALGAGIGTYYAKGWPGCHGSGEGAVAGWTTKW